MLLYETQPFDDESYIYELKLDGIRCLAYIDGKSVVMQNGRRRGIKAFSYGNIGTGGKQKNIRACSSRAKDKPR